MTVAAPRYGGRKTFCARVNGRIVARLVFSHGWVCDFTVQPDYQRLGIGSLLMHKVCAYADEGGWSMFLEPRAEGPIGQAKLERFYEGFGFVWEGRYMRRDPR